MLLQHQMHPPFAAPTSPVIMQPMQPLYSTPDYHHSLCLCSPCFALQNDGLRNSEFHQRAAYGPRYTLHPCALCRTTQSKTTNISIAQDVQTGEISPVPGASLEWDLALGAQGMGWLAAFNINLSSSNVRTTLTAFRHSVVQRDT